MSDTRTNLPGSIAPEDDWAHAFSYKAANVELKRAEGIHLYDTRGNRYIDASGGPMTVNLGHNDPRMQAAVTCQMEAFSYVHPTLANRQRATLCRALAEVAPGTLNTAYLVSGGSEAVETAMKIARQYHVTKGHTGKYKIISCYESYHGMTLATMALSGNPRQTQVFDPMLPQWPHVDHYSDYRRPADVSRDDWALRVAQALERRIYYEGPDTVAAFIATPHACGPDYGTVPPRAYWQEIRRICDAYDVLLIADEVVTGFGRTGKWFAMEHFGVEPDMMTLAKGMSAGYMPLGATLVSDRVNQPFREGQGFIHGFTFGAHAMACAVGLAVIEILKSDGLVARSKEVGRHLFTHEERLRAHPSVADVRGWGLFMVLELVEDRSPRRYFAPEKEAEDLFLQLALKNGLVFYSTLYGPRRRPLLDRGQPIYISPPLVITESQIDELVDRLDDTLREWEETLGVVT